MTGGSAIIARCMVPGVARGTVSRLSRPLSLWGGVDLESGRVCDVNHPEHGQEIAGHVLAMPGGRGSSSSSSVLLESARLGVHPLAIVLAERDPILAVGALVAEDLYGVCIPVVCIRPQDFGRLPRMGDLRVVARPGNSSVEPF